MEILGPYSEWLLRRPKYDLHVRVPDDALTPALESADVVGVIQRRPTNGELTCFRFKATRRLRFAYYHGDWLDLSDGTCLPIQDVEIIGVAVGIVDRLVR